MKNLSDQKRKALEVEIVSSIITRVEFLDCFDLTEADFTHYENKLIFNKILELRSVENMGINIATISLGLPEDLSLMPYIEHINSSFGYPGHTIKSFIELCKILREDTRRMQLQKNFSSSNTSDEFLDLIPDLAQNPLANFLPFSKQVENYKATLLDRIERAKNGTSIGVATGWKHYDQKVSMIPGDYVVVGARTSIGKTTFALNIAIEAAGLGQKVLFISMEMTEESIFDKISARLSQVPVWKFAKGLINEGSVENSLREIEAIQENITLVYMPECTTVQVQTLAKKNPDLDLIVIDYLQLMKDTPRKNETENLRLGRISGALKALAGTQKCVVLVPAQLNRESEKNKREPYLSDLRDSGCIEQDADKVILLHRKDRQSTQTKLILAKNRTGETGEILFRLHPEYSFFEECKDQDLEDLEEENTKGEQQKFLSMKNENT